MALFCRQFATLLSSGIKETECLQLLQLQMHHKNKKNCFKVINQKIAEGHSLSESLQEIPGYFPELLVRMIQIGEMSGALESIFEEMAIYYENEDRLKRELRNALIYPMLLAIMGAATIGVLLFFVIPMFEALFQEVETLPWLTQHIFSVSLVIREKGGYYGAIALLSYALLGGVKKYGQKIKLSDQFKVKLPLIKRFYRCQVTAQFAKTMALLHAQNVDLIESLSLTQQVIGNTVIQQGLDKTKKYITEGVMLSKALEVNGLFPKLLIQMVEIGETGGCLATTLHKVAQLYEDENKIRMKKMLVLVEPLVISGLGVVIGGLLLSIFPAMYQMMGSLS